MFDYYYYCYYYYLNHYASTAVAAIAPAVADVDDFPPTDSTNVKWMMYLIETLRSVDGIDHRLGHPWDTRDLVIQQYGYCNHDTPRPHRPDSGVCG